MINASLPLKNCISTRYISRSKAFRCNLSFNNSFCNKGMPIIKPGITEISKHRYTRRTLLTRPNKTEHFSFKSGCVVNTPRISMGRPCCSSNCIFLPQLKILIMKCKAHLKAKFKCISLTMHSLVDESLLT